MRLPLLSFAFAVAATAAALPLGSWAQSNDDASAKRPVEQPQTTGQAPRMLPAPTGHRQPTTRDVPTESGLPPTHVEKEIDRKLQICRGC
jgi:hypothetical protein